MFSAWDFHSWIASVGAVLFMGILVIGFSAFVGTLMSRLSRKGDREATQLLRIATGCGTSGELVSEAQDSMVGSLF